MTMIVADENIPCAREAFGPLGSVRILPGRSIRREDLLDADALVVRSITRVDRALLDGTPVRFVGTATNGVDHVDLDYLQERAIPFASAGGSNANGVAEYVVAALLELRAQGIVGLAGERLGIIGCGAIGSLVSGYARLLGMVPVEYDPPRAAIDPAFRSASLDDLFACERITLHVPLLEEGEHATRALIDARFLARLRPGTVILNTSRGDVIDSGALAEALAAGRLDAVLDVWEGEPDVPRELIGPARIATPHIAGYPLDAKLRGTAMMADALARFLGTDPVWSLADALPPPADPIHLPDGIAPLDAARLAVAAAFDIMRDDRDLRGLLPLADVERRAGFDRLRKNYRLRREFIAHPFVSSDPAVRSLLKGLGFPSISPFGSPDGE